MIRIFFVEYSFILSEVRSVACFLEADRKVYISTVPRIIRKLHETIQNICEYILVCDKVLTYAENYKGEELKGDEICDLDDVLS